MRVITKDIIIKELTAIGLEKGDVAIQVNSVDMTDEAKAKSIIANWSKMKEAEVVVRRHAHLENIRVNVLNN